ncbi:MAG: serine/threonine-protein kinase, partial [Chloroflexota bacterium]
MQPNIKIANRYILLDKLGQGGMGIVYTAEDRLNSDIVALKQVLLNPNEMQFASRPATDDVQKLRLALAKEFSVLAGLRHPHIISVLDYGFDDTLRPYYTMTLLKDTQDIKTYAENLTQDQKVDLLVQVLQALNYLHRRGILHRDLKPENVLVTNAGQVKVMDLGLAKVEEQTSDANNEDKVVGTIRYIAPEIFETEISSVASDLYAFGIVAYEVLTGRYPFEGTSVFKIIMQIMTEPIDCSMLPLDLANWLEGLLSKDPTARPATAYDVMIGLYKATQREMPSQRKEVRESFLQASAFVGRKTELKQLSDALETLETTNAFFLIGGESGVGKSRLLDELRIQALVKGITVMRGQGVEGGGLPFQLWRNILSRLLLLVEIDNFQAGV